MTQQLSPQGATFLRTLEGFVDHWYADPTGTGTIASGLTWGSLAFQEWWGRHRPGQAFGPGATMTRTEGDDALAFVFNNEYGLAVNHFIGHDVVQHVFDGSGSVVYNCGPGALGDAWASRVRLGDYPQAAILLENDRITSKGRVLQGLINRRRDEAQLIEFGDYVVGSLGVAATQPAPAGLPPRLLERGDHGISVTNLQKKLAQLNLYKGAIDGMFGWGTQAAVLAFQRSHPATGVADGIVGPKTQAALAAA